MRQGDHIDTSLSNLTALDELYNRKIARNNDECLKIKEEAGLTESVCSNALFKNHTIDDGPLRQNVTIDQRLHTDAREHTLGDYLRPSGIDTVDKSASKENSQQVNLNETRKMPQSRTRSHEKIIQSPTPKE